MSQPTRRIVIQGIAAASMYSKRTAAQTKSYDVAIVGAGVFGSWTAHHLRRAGRRVVLIDCYGAANSRQFRWRVASDPLRLRC